MRLDSLFRFDGVEIAGAVLSDDGNFAVTFSLWLLRVQFNNCRLQGDAIFCPVVGDWVRVRTAVEGHSANTSQDALA